MSRQSFAARDAYVRDLEALSERDEQHIPTPAIGDPTRCPFEMATREHVFYRNRDGSVGCAICGFPPKFETPDGDVLRWTDAMIERMQ